MTACLICARHGRHQPTGLDTRCCSACATRISDDLDAIPTLALLASVEPRTGRGSGRTVPASRPPIDLSGIDPALTAVAVPAGTTTVLEVVESWCRLVREERHMAQYGWDMTQRRITPMVADYWGLISDVDRRTAALLRAVADADRDLTYGVPSCITVPALALADAILGGAE